MGKINKALVIAATVATIGGAGVAAVAQTGGPGYPPPGFGATGYGPMGYMHGWGGYGMMGGWQDGYGPPMAGWGGYGFANPAARLATLKRTLGIRPEQAAAWDAYAKAVQDSTKQLQALRGSVDFDKLRTMSWPDRVAAMDRLRERQVAALQPVQAARTALLAALDDAQKSNLSASGPRYPAAGWGGWYCGGPMMGAGYGRMW